MILHFSYEELSALKAGAHAVLDGERASGSPVLAPSLNRERIEALLPQLVGDLSLDTLAEAKAVQGAVRAIVDRLRIEMELNVVATHAADEGAVAAYFDFAHAFTVAYRIDEMVSEMSALIELVTGRPATDHTAGTFQFPD